jgi:predicted ATPase
LTVFVGPNGSGKSTVFDVFAFLSECFSGGLRRAWEARGRFRELRSRDQDGPIRIELKYKESDKPRITYTIEIDEDKKGPFVSYEALKWRRGSHGKPFRFLEFREGHGQAVSGELPDDQEERITETLSSRESLAVNTLGQFEKHPRVSALRSFIQGWHLSYLSAQDPRGAPEAGPQEHLSRTGDNLANVIQYLHEQYPEVLKSILDTLSSRVPRLERVESKHLEDGRLLLRFKDAPFSIPVLARYASDGTIKMLAYLTLMRDPNPAPLIGIEEPENFLHPRLLMELAEECRIATQGTQLMVTTHSPEFVDALDAREVWVLERDSSGYTQANRADKSKIVREMMSEGAHLGDLWMEGYLHSSESWT